MIIKISNNIMTADINTLGAELKSLCDEKGNQFIWDGSKYWGRSAPFLFPVVGGQRNNEMLIEGKKYPVKQHGFARDMEWTVKCHEGNKAVFTLAYNEDTLKVYPYRFLLTVTYTLVERFIKIDIEVENSGENKMLYCFGTHPAIRCPFADSKAEFNQYYVQFNKAENSSQVILNSDREVDTENRIRFMSDSKTFNLDYDVFVKNDAVIYDNINSDMVRLKNTVDNRYIEVRFRNFTQFGLWSPCEDAPFVCIEPWNGCATLINEDGSYENKLGVRSLDSNKNEKFLLEIDTANV